MWFLMKNPYFNESVQGQWKLAELKFPVILRSKLCTLDVEDLVLARISDYQVRPPGETQRRDRECLLSTLNSASCTLLASAKCATPPIWDPRMF